jgi:O-methyltransferase
MVQPKKGDLPAAALALTGIPVLRIQIRSLGLRRTIMDKFRDDLRARAPLPLNTTVYNAFPSFAQMHAVDRTNYADIREDAFWAVFERCKPYTCLSVERFYNIFKSIEYIASADIPGDIVECGVFLGGSILGAAHFAEHFGLRGRTFYLCDTFEGFPVNTFETDAFGSSSDLSDLKVFNQNFRHIVEKNIEQSGLAKSQFKLVQGLVEDTLQITSFGPLAYLRLDTDYYQSTLIEMDVLYPKLNANGVLIIDDYGHFEGARNAIEDYFKKAGKRPLLQRVDYTGRCGVKI